MLIMELVRCFRVDNLKNDVYNASAEGASEKLHDYHLSTHSTHRSFLYVCNNDICIGYHVHIHDNLGAAPPLPFLSDVWAHGKQPRSEKF
jgi:hypothetical protein